MAINSRAWPNAEHARQPPDIPQGFAPGAAKGPSATLRAYSVRQLADYEGGSAAKHEACLHRSTRSHRYGTSGESGGSLNSSGFCRS
jgi:hypothetical protein